MITSKVAWPIFLIAIIHLFIYVGIVGYFEVRIDNLKCEQISFYDDSEKQEILCEIAK